MAKPIPQLCASRPRVCVGIEKVFEFCPYEECVDDCASDSMVSPCNTLSTSVTLVSDARWVSFRFRGGFIFGGGDCMLMKIGCAVACR